MKKEFLRSFWKLFKGYWFHSEEKWKARGLLAVVIFLNLAMVYLLVQLNLWNNDFYNALQERDFTLFWPLTGRFLGLAFIYIMIAVYAVYLRQMLQLKWRTWMTGKYLDSYLARQTYYRLQVLGSDTDNPDQRISEDINQFVALSLQLFLGFISQLTTLAAFAVVLWDLSGTIEIPLGDSTITIYGYMFWVSLIYSCLGTLAAHIVGRKLIGLNFDQQRFEADFRFDMMRMRENSESIAFYGGEQPERSEFNARFGNVIKNFWALMRQTKLLNFYANSYAQIAVILPLVMAAPRYFSGAMQLGGLMQTLSAFGRVQDALSYFVNAYDTIAQLIATIHRLGGFTAHMEEVSTISMGVNGTVGGDDFALEQVTVALPDGRVLTQDISLALSGGQRLLVTGLSGCGKSTLLRTLAGIWPFGSGTIRKPEGKTVLFLPQRPYLPLGSLRQALAYPQEPKGQDGELTKILALVDLPSLAAKLDVVDDWSRILSLGEQQRLAFARVLLVRPDYLFLDEATSALDEPREQEMYTLLRKELPNMSIVSVAHRSTLRAQHDQELHLEGGTYELRPIG